MKQTNEITTWWGRHRLPPDRSDLWTIGPLEVLAEHFETFWRIQWRYVDRKGHGSSRVMGITADAIKEFSAGRQPASSLSPYFGAKVQAVTVPAASPNEDLIFSPLLPDESLILSLASSAVLDPGEKLKVGFRIPLSLRVETAAGQSPSREVCEIPLLPLVRTWGGVTPMDGELMLTPAEIMSVEKWSDVSPRLDVAGLATEITHLGTDSVFLDRILVPCRKLALFHSAQTGFWTDLLLLKANAEFGGIRSIATTQRTFPREAGAPTLVAQAREGSEESSALRGLQNFKTTIGNSVENLFKERG